MSVFIILLFIIAILIIVCKNSCSQNTNTIINNSDLSDNKPVKKVMRYAYICERCGYIEFFTPNMDVECRYCGYEHMLQTWSSSEDFSNGYFHEYPERRKRYVESYNFKLKKQYVYIPTNRVYDEEAYNS